ncbi:MAG: carboxypeptidase-like regulatory domain-containing protein [Anaerolineae bacterium]|jgi:hypothetical protein|nr:carboxypeptidase-like regulatory domain-containing protein [Anaerolineae bacterium]
MSELSIQRYASIMGIVRDTATGLPVRNARVEITQAPEQFEVTRTLKRAQVDPFFWRNAPERVDRRQTRADGSYFFESLPPGRYRLKCSALGDGVRYITIETADIEVKATEEGAGGNTPALIDIEIQPNR